MLSPKGERALTNSGEGTGHLCAVLLPLPFCSLVPSPSPPTWEGSREKDVSGGFSGSYLSGGSD